MPMVDCVSSIVGTGGNRHSRVELGCLQQVPGPKGRLGSETGLELGNLERQAVAVRNTMPVWFMGRLKVWGQHVTVTIDL